MRFLVAVPARLESSRLPRKVLAEIGGVAMLQRTLDGTRGSKWVAEVVLCTDSDEVAREARSWGHRVVMTSPECSSGSERIASVIDQLDADVIINVQGDQPFVDATIIDAMCEVFTNNSPTPEVVTPIYRLPVAKLSSPDAVKVVVSNEGRALYFSRSAIPHVRGIELAQWANHGVHWGHVGMYGYQRSVLQRWNSLPPSALEAAEKLEQLRLLDNGISITTYEIVANPRNTLSVDSPSDLDLARQLVKQ